MTWLFPDSGARNGNKDYKEMRSPVPWYSSGAKTNAEKKAIKANEKKAQKKEAARIKAIEKKAERKANGGGFWS